MLLVSLTSLHLSCPLVFYSYVFVVWACAVVHSYNLFKVLLHAFLIMLFYRMFIYFSILLYHNIGCYIEYTGTFWAQCEWQPVAATMSFFVLCFCILVLPFTPVVRQDDRELGADEYFYNHISFMDFFYRLVMPAMALALSTAGIS